MLDTQLTTHRILAWYSIITIFFRCPATIDLVSDSSPKICKPYFQLRSTVVPHLEPYYNTYAASYVDAARPYYNTVDRIIIAPAASLATKYGAPHVAKAQAFGQAQWNKIVQPQVLKYRSIAKGQYDQTLAPHLNKATSVVAPYYDIAKTNALQTYYGHILPTYNTVQPYAIQGYSVASDFVTSTAVPYSQWVWATGGVFLDRTVFPKLRVLYGENVEPQLVRIGERLGRYRDGKKLKAAVDSVDRYSFIGLSIIQRTDYIVVLPPQHLHLLLTHHCHPQLLRLMKRPLQAARPPLLKKQLILLKLNLKLKLKSLHSLRL